MIFSKFCKLRCGYLGCFHCFIAGSWIRKLNGVCVSGNHSSVVYVIMKEKTGILQGLVVMVTANKIGRKGRCNGKDKERKTALTQGVRHAIHTQQSSYISQPEQDMWP